MFILTAIAAVDHAAAIVGSTARKIRHRVIRATVPVATTAIGAVDARITKAAAPAIVAYRNGATTTKAVKSGELVTVTTHLATLGADDDTQRRYGSHAGKKIKAAYIARTGVQPRRIWTLSGSGYPIEVYAYTRNDQALTDGIAAYGRVAHLVAA